MNAQQSAQGLASLGRYGDNMLVHMNPKEVAGLQQLALSKGGTLTINPDTGMPEAFLGKIFDVAAPIIGGFFGLSPWLTAGIMGGKSLLEGDDPLEAAFSAFGGYTGGKMGASLKNFTAPLKVPTAELNTFEQAASNVDSLNPKNLMQADTTPFNKIGTQSVGVNLGQSPEINQVLNQAPSGNLGFPNFNRPVVPTEVFGKVSSTPTIDIASNATRGVQIPDATQAVSSAGEFGGALGRVAQDPIGFAREVGEGDALMGAGKIGMHAAGPFMEDILQPPEFNMDRSEDEKYDPTRRLSLSNDTGLRLLPNLNQPIRAAQGGAIKSYALGGNVGNPSVGGGLSSLYNRPEGQAPQNISNDAYGLGRLSDLGSEQARYQAQTLGYAMGGLTALKSGGQPGGYLDGEGDGMSDSIPATIEGKQPARLADGEFVIPADVVSHLGNGSSKAGSKRLYAMLDKVRHARTGNKKQGKQIKPEKYMPKVA